MADGIFNQGNGGNLKNKGDDLIQFEEKVVMRRTVIALSIKKEEWMTMRLYLFVKNTISPLY